MNDSCKDANGYLQPRRARSQNPDVPEIESVQSECGGLISASSAASAGNGNQYDEVPQSGNVYTSLRARKMALRRKRSLSVAGKSCLFFPTCKFFVC